MNDQEFILLIEQYLDGSISPDGRRALREAVEADPERRRVLETQARQHVRLHAQTSRVDFTESQRVAAMVVDVVEKERHTHFADILREQTLRERLAAISRGLRAPRDSGPHRYARFALLRIFGPPSVSLGLSAAVIVLLILFAVPVVRPPDQRDEGPVIDLVPAPASSALEPQPRPPTPSPEPATSPTEGAEPVAPIEQPTRITWEDTPLPPPVTGGTATRMKPMPAAHALPAALTGRTETGRADILQGTDRHTHTERAVTNALRWLKDHQVGDGSWAGQEPVAMTGLALLVYLAHGELPASGEYAATVRKALDYLLARQDSKGAFSRNVYAHAIATYAVSEAFTLTRHMGLRDPMERAIAVVVNGQQPDGSYDYNYAKGTRFDTSVTGWQIQALKAARLAGSDNPGLDAAMERCARFLKNQAFARDGSGFVYSGEPGTQPASGAKWTMTAVGALSLQLLGHPHAPQTRAGLKILEDLSFAWPRTPGEKASVYGGYYVTQAKFQQGNKPVWRAWNDAFQSALLAHQAPDGHWEGGDYDQGSHVYTTTLCTLMLEVYYRYLPTYGPATNVVVTAHADGDDIAVRVQ